MSCKTGLLVKSLLLTKRRSCSRFQNVMFDGGPAKGPLSYKTDYGFRIRVWFEKIRLSCPTLACVRNHWLPVSRVRKGKGFYICRPLGYKNSFGSFCKAKWLKRAKVSALHRTRPNSWDWKDLLLQRTFFPQIPLIITTTYILLPRKALYK